MPLSDEIITNARNNVAQDIHDSFSKYIQPSPTGEFAVELPGVQLAERDVIVASESVVAVPWVFRGEHVDVFLSVPATGLPIELRGATFVDVSSGKESDWTYSRFIDYLGALHQLGVTGVSRPAFGPDYFQEVVKYMRSQ
jgi:hypothetical protein